MPMKPATPDRTAPIRKPIAAVMDKQPPRQKQHDHADNRDGGVLARKICLRTLADSG